MAPERVIDAVERLIFASVGLTTRALQASAAAGDLTVPQWRLVALLGEAERPLRVGEIAERMGMSLPSASRLVARVEERGLVTGEPDARDRRALLVGLSAGGRTVLDDVVAIRRRLVAEALDGGHDDLPPGFAERLEALASSLGRLASVALLVAAMG